MVAQYAGAKDFHKVRQTINNSLVLLGSIAALLSILGVMLSRAILQLYSVSPEILDQAAGYLSIIMGGMIFTVGYNLFSSVSRGLGDSMTPMKYLAYTTVINFVLDPLFIAGWGPIPKMGVNGAALATVLAQAISMIMMILFFNRKSEIYKLKWRELGFNGELTRIMVRIGLPSAIQQALVSVGSSVLSKIVNSYGVAATSAFGAASRVDSFAFMPSMSIQLATAAQVGQNMGAGKEERVKEVVFWASLLSAGITLLFSLVAFFFPEAILRLFLKSPEYLQIGVDYLGILSFAYIAFSLMFVTNGVMNGAGDTFATMIFSLITLWFLRLPLAYFFAKGLGMGTRGIWTATAVSYVAGMIISRAYYMTGRWKKKAFARRAAVGGE